jgi:protein-tyrosine phosphatase
MIILFVCTGNAFRSPVAESLLKKLRSDIRVDSAGIYPARRIASNAKRLLKNESAMGYLKASPEGVYEKRMAEYDLIIVMKEEHRRKVINWFPHIKAKVEVWDIDDPYFLPYSHDQKIFEEIRKKVISLAHSL